MSRPFSYNDENFTVIGNVLFVHLKYEQAADPGERLCEIPRAIFDRLLFYSNFGSTGYPVLGASGGTFHLMTIEYENKFYLSNTISMKKMDNRYIFAIFMLKDV